MGGSRDGIALLDVLLGLLVLSLLTMVGLPALVPGTSPSRLEAYAAEVAALVKSDRAAAAQTGVRIGTRIDLARRQISAGARPRSARPRSVRLPDDLALDVLTSERCGRENDSIVIAFEADGRSCGGVIRIAKGDLSWRIRINWLTGYVDVAGPV